MRSPLNNAAIGVTKDYMKKLEVQGIGFEVDLNGKELVLKVTFIVPKKSTISNTVQVENPMLTEIVISGPSTGRLGRWQRRFGSSTSPNPTRVRASKTPNAEQFKHS